MSIRERMQQMANNSYGMSVSKEHLDIVVMLAAYRWAYLVNGDLSEWTGPLLERLKGPLAEEFNELEQALKSRLKNLSNEVLAVAIRVTGTSELAGLAAIEEDGFLEWGIFEFIESVRAEKIIRLYDGRKVRS